MSTRKSKGEQQRRRVAAHGAMLAWAQQHTGPTISFPTLYNVGLGAAPTGIAFNGIGRTAVRADAGSTLLGKGLKGVTIKYRHYGSPTGNISVGVRKNADDSFILIAQWPIDNNPATPASTIRTAVIENGGGQFVVYAGGPADPMYPLVASDRISIEYPSNATNGIEIMASTSEAFPANTTSQTHNGTTWANTASNRPLAVTIQMRQSV
jgi:hypothetical protein